MRAQAWTGGARGRWRGCTAPPTPWAGSTRDTRAGYPPRMREHPAPGARWPGACRSPSLAPRVLTRGWRLCCISWEAPDRGQWPTGDGDNTYLELHYYSLLLSSPNIIPPDLVSGTPGDTLQYLSQLEMVARKLKHQLIKQKQDDRQPTSETKIYKAQEESEC